MTQLVLNIQDESLLTQIKKACMLLKGVMSVKVVKTETAKKENDITKTVHYREAMEDVKNGRVYHADSVEDMMNLILG